MDIDENRYIYRYDNLIEENFSLKKLDKILFSYMMHNDIYSMKKHNMIKNVITIFSCFYRLNRLKNMPPMLEIDETFLDIIEDIDKFEFIVTELSSLDFNHSIDQKEDPNSFYTVISYCFKQYGDLKHDTIDMEVLYDFLKDNYKKEIELVIDYMEEGLI